MTSHPQSLQELSDHMLDIIGGQHQPDDGKDFLDWLREDNNYIAPVRVGNHWVACEQLLFHGSLIGGDWGDYVSVRWRYCYKDVPTAGRAMAAWINGNCEGEPQGWHKRRSDPMIIAPLHEPVGSN